MPVPTKILQTRYGLHGPASLTWFNKSNDLRGACAAIWHSIQTEDVALKQDYGLGSQYSFACAVPSVFAMNAGLSLELLFKAIWIQANFANFEKVPKTHDLKELARKADAIGQFSDDQILLLEIFSLYSLWIGKYPIPKDEESYCKATETMSKTRRTGGRLIEMHIPALTPNWKNYNEIWVTGSAYYWKLEEAV